MKKIKIPKWIIETTFKCDITKGDFKYQELHIAWYDKHVNENGITIEYNDKFMLVKSGEGFRQLNNRVLNEWSLSSRSLEKVFQENVLLFFTDLLVVDSIHDQGNFVKKTNLKSWTELLRRLTIPNYEIARHRLSEAKLMDDFLEFTEFQLLQADTLANFLKSLN